MSVEPVAILGLGEAGGELARGLVRAGCAVVGFDPDPEARPPGVRLAGSAREAACGAGAVLSVNVAAVAAGVAAEVAPGLVAGQLYADLNTAPPSLKAELSQIVAPTGALFVDVALLGPVPGRGLAVPSLASGPGAEAFCHRFRPLGWPIEAIGLLPGEAAARKLLRSVFMKGLAASVLESLAAARALGLEDWLREQIVRALESPSRSLVERLEAGSRAHATRRTEEMTAAAELLSELGIEPRVALAARDLLAALAEGGRPTPR